VEQSLVLGHDQALARASEAADRFGVAALSPLSGTFQKERLADKTAGAPKAGKAKAGKDK
jgi:hypothetical protein